MRRLAIVLPVVLALACERSSEAIAEEQAKQVEVSPSLSPAPAAPEPESIDEKEPAAEAPAAIPSLQLTRLETEREGSFMLPEDTDELMPRAAVVLGRGFAVVGEAHARGRPDHPPQTWRWVGYVSDVDQASEGVGTKLAAGSIRAAVSDGKGGALLVGSVASGTDARGWFGVLDAKGVVGRQLELDGEASTELVGLLAGHGPDQHALVLGNVDGQGWVASLGSRGAVRWDSYVGSGDSVQNHAAARVAGERGDVLAIGTRVQLGGESESWWALIPDHGGADAKVEQGNFEIEGADRLQTLDAIVDLQGTGFLALGRAKRERAQDHDQVIAVGFDRTGEPTWIRVLERFRAIEIYGGAGNPALLGAANFVVRVPITGGEGTSALAWLEIYPGVDGILVPRQLAGTIGWESAGFIEDREGSAIVTFKRTETGIDWRILPLGTTYRVGSPS
jgi:hypothetical protein